MISLLTPTRKRKDRLWQMIESARMTARKEFEVICYIADDDDSYGVPPETSVVSWPGSDSGFERMNPWVPYRTVFARGPRVIMSDLWNACIPHATGDIFQLAADDVIYRTPGWDVIVEEAFAAVPDRILLAFGDDGGPTGKIFSTLPFVHRRWVETIGYFTGPGFSADFSDSWPFDVATMVGRVKFLPIVTEHMHWVHGKAPKDQTYLENIERYHRDQPDQLYIRRLPERIADAEKLRKVMTP
jgi:hypothetical protein